MSNVVINGKIQFRREMVVFGGSAAVSLLPYEGCCTNIPKTTESVPSLRICSAEIKVNPQFKFSIFNSPQNLNTNFQVLIFLMDYSIPDNKNDK